MKTKTLLAVLAAFSLTALASASIDLHGYQMDVVRRVLHKRVETAARRPAREA